MSGKDQDVCNTKLIQAIVGGDPIEPESGERLCRHLDRCARCRDQINELWQPIDQQTRELLRPEPFDEQSGIYLRNSEHFESGTQPDTPPNSLAVQNVLDSLTPTDDPDMLGRLGAYEVSGVVGVGGMGVVLKAFDRSRDRMVAIKVLTPHLACSGAARRRFAREAKAAAAILHPNVVAIHGVSAGDDGKSLPYLVMPYLRGHSLQTRLDANGPLSTIEVLRVSLQVAQGLAAAHSQGLVHRDIKPANILLEEGIERVSITDFGLARTADDVTLTRSGVIAGTPQYMSPEQARGEVTDARSDLFSLGSVMYAMCTGHAPFRAESCYGILRRITDDTPRPIRQVNPEIPDWLCRLVERLHEKSSEDRYPTAATVAETLHQCLTHVQSPEARLPRDLVLNRWRRWSKQRLMQSLGVAILLVGLVAVFAAMRSEQPADQAISAAGQADFNTDSPADSSVVVAPPSKQADDLLWNDPSEPALETVQSLINSLDRETRRSFDEIP